VADRFLHGDPPHVALDAFRERHAEVASLEEVHPGASARVARMDRPGAYLLIPIYADRGLCGIVQLDAETLIVESSAAVRDPTTAFLASPAEALAAARAAIPDADYLGQAYLAWRPCRESFDSMRPLWVIPHAGGTAYVTQDLKVYKALTVGRGG
jgi:hypothetical protein